MKKRGSIFVLTGAGISAESGIPVFQGTSWRGHSHYELANVEAWERDPQLVWEYYSDRRARARDAKPNAAHIALAEWENDLAGRLFLCTQNVDGLHEAAGSQDVVHIHGKLFESRCAADCGRPLLPTVAITLKASCRAVFAEPWCVRMSAGLASSRIILVALMTRCKGVKPVASFVTMLKQKPRPARTVFLGLTEPSNAKYFDEIHLGPAAELVPQAVGSLSKLLRQD